jgi:hypothetical protein
MATQIRKIWSVSPLSSFNVSPSNLTYAEALGDDDPDSIIYGTEISFTFDITLFDIPLTATNIVFTIYTSLDISGAGQSININLSGTDSNYFSLQLTGPVNGIFTPSWQNLDANQNSIEAYKINNLLTGTVYHNGAVAAVIKEIYFAVDYFDTGNLTADNNEILSSVSQPALTSKPTTLHLSPIADYSTAGTWTGTVNSRYQLINDFPDSSSTYLTHGTSAGNILFEKAPINLPTNYVIQSVVVKFYAQKTTASTANIRGYISNGTNTVSGTSVNPSSSSGQLIQHTFTTAPDGSAWTQENFNSMYFGVSSSDANPTIRIYSVVIAITYDWTENSEPELTCQDSLVAINSGQPLLTASRVLSSTGTAITPQSSYGVPIEIISTDVRDVTVQANSQQPTVLKVKAVSIDNAAVNNSSLYAPTIVTRSLDPQDVIISSSVSKPGLTLPDALLVNFSQVSSNVGQPQLSVSKILSFDNNLVVTNVIKASTTYTISINPDDVSVSSSVTKPDAVKSGTGQVYYSIYPSAQGNPTVAQIKAGTNATKYGSLISPTVGTNIVDGPLFTDIAAGNYKVAWVYSDGTNESFAIYSNEYTIPAATINLTTNSVTVSPSSSQPDAVESIALGIRNVTVSIDSQKPELLGGIVVSVNNVSTIQQILEASLVKTIPITASNIVITKNTSTAITPIVSTGFLYWNIHADTAPAPTNAEIVNSVAWQHTVSYGISQVPLSTQTVTLDPVNLPSGNYSISWVVYINSQYSNVVRSGSYTISSNTISLNANNSSNDLQVSQPFLTVGTTTINLVADNCVQTIDSKTTTIYVDIIVTDISVRNITLNSTMSQPGLLHTRSIYVSDSNVNIDIQVSRVNVSRTIQGTNISLTNNSRAANLSGDYVARHIIPVSSRISSVKLRS